MAQNKKSFVAYCDWLDSFEELSDEEAGKLVKHLFRYVNDKNPEAPDKLTKMCFIPIQQSLKRDLKKYESYVKKQSENGLKGGRPPKPKEPKKPNALNGNPTEPKKADSVSVSVSVNDTVNEIKKENASRSYFDNQVLNDVFSNWMKMCGERGKPFAQSQIEALQMKLNTQSETKSINQVRQSLEKGWLNLRPYEETESKMSAQDEEEMDIAILKHLRDVQLEDDNPGTAENNRLRGIS
jgi:hypothetical protein